MAVNNFEVGVVLPATTQLKITVMGDISYSSAIIKVATDENILIGGYNPGGWNIASIGWYPGELYYVFDDSEMGWDYGFNEDGGYVVIDTSLLNESKRTVTFVDLDELNVTWEDLAPAPSGYSITFEENGGSSISNITEATELPTPLPISAKPGYTFGGWYYESNFQTRAKAGDTIEANTTLYAKWLTLAQVLEHINNVVEELRSAIIDKGGDAEGKLLIDFATIINSLKTYEVVETLAELELLEPTLNRIVYVVEGSGELTMGAPVKVTQDGDTLIIG